MCKERYPETMVLRDIAGVGPVVELYSSMWIGTPLSFKVSHSTMGCIGYQEPLDITPEIPNLHT